MKFMSRPSEWGGEWSAGMGRLKTEGRNLVWGGVGSRSGGLRNPEWLEQVGVWH